MVDGDLVGYRSAASCEPTKLKPDREPLEVAIARCDDLMRRILHETNAPSYQCYIGGSENFRYDIDPNYKANRKDKPRPMWLQEVREYLVMNWNTQICDGIEADDALGIAQCNSYEESCIASIDKDMLQIPGNHFNFVASTWSHISPRQGWHHFYTQLIMGDKSDNIQGYDGKMRPTVPQFLQPVIDRIYAATTEIEMLRVVQDVYELGDEALLRNGRLLYIQREQDDVWHLPTEISTEAS